MNESLPVYMIILMASETDMRATKVQHAYLLNFCFVFKLFISTLNFSEIIWFDYLALRSLDRISSLSF